MALKMRFLYYSKKAKMKALAEAIKAEFELSQNYNLLRTNTGNWSLN